MSFQEKSIVASLLTTLVVWSYYFYELYEARLADAVTLEAVKGLLFVAVVLTVVVSIVVHSFIAGRNAVGSGNEPERDERDRLIDQRATNIASYVLVTGVISTVAVAVFSNRLVPTLNVLLFFFVLSEIVRYALQLVFYRRGI